MSRHMIFSTLWYLRSAKPQISLYIRAVWSEPLLVAWIFYVYWATDQTPFGVSKLNRRLHRLVWIYTCQNATLLEITFRGSGDERSCICLHTKKNNKSTVILQMSRDRYETYQTGFKFEGLLIHPLGGLRGWSRGLIFFRIWPCFISN